MANETELGNVVTPTDEVADISARALLETVKVLPFVFDVGMPTSSKTTKVGRRGNFVAEAGSESSAYTFSANSEYSETSVTLTAARTEVIMKRTVEMKRWGGRAAQLDFIAEELGRSIARKLEGDVKTLFSGFSTSETASSTLTTAEVIDSGTAIRAALADDGLLVSFLDYKGIGELQKVVSSSQAAVYANPNIPTLLKGYDGSNGYVGEYAGMQLFGTSGLPTDTGDDVGLTFNPQLAFCGIYDSEPEINVVFKGSEGFWDEISAYLFSAVAEWNDGAGCTIKSDT